MARLGPLAERLYKESRMYPWKDEWQFTKHSRAWLESEEEEWNRLVNLGYTGEEAHILMADG